MGENNSNSVKENNFVAFISINGFGEIGRNITRKIILSGGLISVINDPNLTITQARTLLEYDSIQGKFKYSVIGNGKYLEIPEAGIKILFERKKDLEKVNWKNTQIIIDSSPKTNVKKWKRLLSKKKIKQVLITHHENKADKIIVKGINEDKLNSQSKLLSLSTCDGVAISPILKLVSKFGIKSINIISLHPYLLNQKLRDGVNNKVNELDLSLWRSAQDSIIPRNTSIAKVCSDLVPQVKSKIKAYQLRVPISLVSCAHITIQINKEVSKSSLKKLFNNSGVIKINSEELVSKDFAGNSFSSIIDSREFNINKKIISLLIWYDNISGYSERVVDIIKQLSHANSKPQNKKSNNLLAVVTKEPNKNTVKTRLAKEIGKPNAYKFYINCLNDLFLNHALSKEYDFYFSVNVLNKTVDFAKITNFSNTLKIRSNSLADHLKKTLFCGLKKYKKVVITATDIPQLSQNSVLRAIKLLNKYDMVIGPTIDGGYYLIALKKPVDVFSKIAMGKTNVCKETIKLAKNNGLKVFVLPQSIDVDTFSDLKSFVKNKDYYLARNTKQFLKNFFRGDLND